MENAFGILANRFLVFHSPINLPPDTVEVLVLACTALHNFLRKDETNAYFNGDEPLDTENYADGTITPGDWRKYGPELTSLKPMRCNASMEAKEVREKYMEYFRGSGAVSWQNRLFQNSTNK